MSFRFILQPRSLSEAVLCPGYKPQCRVVFGLQLGTICQASEATPGNTDLMDLGKEGASAQGKGCCTETAEGPGRQNGHLDFRCLTVAHSKQGHRSSE
jgi:hypothetical protein